MIAYLKGILAEVAEESLIVDLAGIGYQVRVPQRVLEQLPSVGNPIKLHTYTYVREDALALYGFLTRDDLQMFQLLLGVSGVGPKGALGILSLFSASQFRLALLSQDTKTISKAPGIGAKTAQRILIDLKGKVSLEDALSPEGEGLLQETQGKGDSRARNDAIEALTALGYSASEALRAVSSVTLGEDADSEAILKAALKALF